MPLDNRRGCVPTIPVDELWQYLEDHDLLVTRMWWEGDSMMIATRKKPLTTTPGSVILYSDTTEARTNAQHSVTSGVG